MTNQHYHHDRMWQNMICANSYPQKDHKLMKEPISLLDIKV